MARPKFSIVIPAHNEEAYIGECMESVRSQSYTDVQVIIVCDRCTDRTPAVARAFGYEPLEVEAGSLGRARNAGLEHATGEYLLFLDSDDYYISRDALRIIALQLMSQPVDLLAFGFMFGPRLARPVRPGNNLWPNVWSKVWRTEVFGHLRFGDMITAEDVAWNEIALPLATSISTLDVPLIQYRYPRKGSITSRVLSGEWTWGQMNEHAQSDFRGTPT